LAAPIQKQLAAVFQQVPIEAMKPKILMVNAFRTAESNASSRHNNANLFKKTLTNAATVYPQANFRGFEQGENALPRLSYL
jgi:hypothetical protein